MATKTLVAEKEEMNTTGSGNPAQTVRKSGSTQPVPHGSQQPVVSSGAVQAVVGGADRVIGKADANEMNQPNRR